MTARLLSVAVLVALSVTAKGCGGDNSPIISVADIAGTPEAQGMSSIWPPDPGWKPPACKPKVGFAPKTDREFIHVSVLLRKDGSVEDVSLIRSDVTDAGCDDALVKAVRQWQFPRYLKDGRPVRARFDLGIGFPFNHQ